MLLFYFLFLSLYTAGSARQRESDAGALLLRTLFTIYSLSLGWHCSTEASASTGSLTLSFSSPVNTSSPPPKEAASRACSTFVCSLCDLLGDRLGRLEGLFTSFNVIPTITKETEKELDSDRVVEDAEAPEPLCHGLMLALRYCLKELHTSELLGPPVLKELGSVTRAEIVGSVWRPLINRVLSLSLNALRVAMLVVAEAPCDAQFAPAPTAKMRGEYTLPGAVVEEPAQVGIKVCKVYLA